MVSYSIASGSVPLGGQATANIDSFDSGVASDVDSVKAQWFDNTGLSLVSLTRTTIDVSGTDIYGNAATVTDPAGTGIYRATLVIDLTHYSPPAAGLRWSLAVTITKGVKTDTKVFYFNITPTSLSITIDDVGIADAVMRQTGLTEDVIYVANDTNAYISLRGGPVYAIVAAYKNGNPLTLLTDYAWSMFRTNVLVTPAPAVNDHYVFTVQKRSTAFINDIVSRHVQEVNRSLMPHYDTLGTTFLQSPSVTELIKALCIGQLRQELATGIALDSAWYRAGRDLQLEARAQIKRIQRGEEDIYDTAGTAVTRRTGTLVGGQRHSDGDFVNRLGLQDRAQGHTGLFITLHPDPILALRRTLTTGTRGAEV